jgi:hypothetical protein
MDWSQWLYLGLLALAFSTGRPRRVIVGAMTFNLVATVLLAHDPVSVVVADLLTAGLLIGEGRRANIVALFFVAMQPVYVAGHYLGLNYSVIYALIDVLAYAQLCVIGGWDVGLRRLYRSRSGRHRRADSPTISWDHVSRG